MYPSAGGLSRWIPIVVLLMFAVLMSTPVWAVRVQYFGHSAFKITTDAGNVIMIDPFLTGNPKTPEQYKNLAQLGPVDLILLTHGHGDHIGDTPRLAKLTGAKVALNADLGHTLGTLGMVPYDQIIRFNKSGPIRPLGKDVTVTMVHAEHSSEVLHTDPGNGQKRLHPGGEPAGYILEFSSGLVIYHAGDTGVFGDMRYIGSFYQPDLAMLPIGGHFTMDPEHAAYAVRELLNIDTIIPIHYGTFSLLKGTPEQLKEALGRFPARVLVMKPGETRSFD